MSFSSSAFCMQFELTPLGERSRVEVNLSTGFGGGSLKGSFSKIYGSFDFSVESPSLSKGEALMDARSLRFGYGEINQDAHKTDWLDSARFPKVAFRMNGLKNTNWTGKVLQADAHGSLSLKGQVAEISFPVNIRYLRQGRRKFDGKHGDVLVIEGILSFNRADFGLNRGKMLGEIMNRISVGVTVCG